MTPRTKRIVGKSLVVTTIAVVATFGLSFTARLALQMPIDWLSWVECTFIPILIGMPVSAYIFTQSETIQDTCNKLEKSHAALTEAHDRLSFVTSHDPMTGLLSRATDLCQLHHAGEWIHGTDGQKPRRRGMRHTSSGRSGSLLFHQR
ncbi:hypothetical protein [Mesorhizobium comanense]|uniref:hypothetical protein n=1 Tax=Mesorhizobium comanense TaxID=2502215 RepID=UPI001485B0CF|nr:hypothetical protein [Mesorhizobium comanense]